MNQMTTVTLALAVAGLVLMSCPAWVERFKMPTWVMPPETWSPGSQSHNELNRKDIQKDSDKRYDVVMYGDSITAGLRIYKAETQKIIETHFPGKKFGAFGVPGNLVEGLAWRLMSGTEKPKLDPKVVVLWIGTNNVSTGKSKPEKPLGDLIAWMKTNMPESKIVVLGLLRRDKFDTAPANAALKAMAKRLGVMYVSCGSELDPADKRMFPDGLHPSPAGHDVVLSCLSARVRSLL